jgi:hypothetical protein
MVPAALEALRVRVYLSRPPSPSAVPHAADSLTSQLSGVYNI